MPKRNKRANGEGTIYRRKSDSRWVGSITLRVGADKKLRRPTVYGETQAEVLAKLNELKRDNSVKHVTDESLTVGQHFQDWLRSKKAGIRSSTYNQYDGHAKCHIIPKLGHIKLKDLDYRTISQFYEQLQECGTLGTRTIYDISSILRSGLKDAVMKHLIVENPALLASKLSRGDEEASFLNSQELAAFLTAAKGERLEDAFIVAVNTGLRPSEWLGLPWDAVDLDKGRLTVRQALHEEKGKLILGPVKSKAAKRTISLPQEAVRALRRQHVRQSKDKLAAGSNWRNEWNLVFTNRKGGPLYRTHIGKRDMKRILARAALLAVAKRNKCTLEEILRENRKLGLVQLDAEIKLPGDRIDTIKEADILTDITLHTFRHTHASMLIAAGVDIKTISRRLGHENIRVTLQIYGHLMPGKDEEAASVMDDIFASLPVEESAK